MDNIIDLNKIKADTFRNSPAGRFLDICKETLIDDDYDDLITAINDPEFYSQCDEEIQDLVDGYYNNIYRS